MAGLDTVLNRQALITGRILDALTGEPAPGPVVVTVTDRNNPDRPPNLAVRLVAGGGYAVTGDPAVALPAGVAAALRVTAMIDRYEPAIADIDIAAPDTVPAPVTRTIGGRSLDLLLLNAPLAIRDLTLTPRPVALTGRVVEADDRNSGLAGAAVQVTAPTPHGPATADADGFYTLADLPVAASLTVQVSAPGRITLTTDIRIDYRTPTNQRTFALAA